MACSMSKGLDAGGFNHMVSDGASNAEQIWPQTRSNQELAQP